MKIRPSELIATIEPAVETGIFWRLHWPNLPAFSRAAAWSRPWGETGRASRGYSAMESAEALVRYMKTHGSSIADNDPIVVFEGAVIGIGPDNEPLVLPRRVIAWIRGKDLDEGILEHENDPEQLAAVLSVVGSRSRSRQALTRKHKKEK